MNKHKCITESKICIKCNSIFYRKNTHRSIEEFKKQKYCSFTCVLNDRKLTFEQRKEKNKIKQKRKDKSKRKRLSDSYIRVELKKQHGLKCSDVTPELLALKKIQMLLNRTIKENKL